PHQPPHSPIQPPFPASHHPHPLIGKSTANALRSAKRSIRRMIIPTTLFDDLGFTYIGPVNGHDLNSLISVFEYVKEEKKPVLIHIRTKKGKGYAPAENNPQKFHGISSFDPITGETKKSDETYSDRFGTTLLELAKKNDKIVAITGAMPNGTGISEFPKYFKNRFFDVGIAEQHGTTLAAGFAAAGYIPVIPLYSSFLQRAYDQTLHDVCLQNLHVVFPIDRAGIVGADGETHQGIYDISYLSHMPNMSILSPSTFLELDKMLGYAVNEHNGPIAIRYPRGSVQAQSIETDFVFGQAVKIASGRDVSIVASGRMLKRAREVSDILNQRKVSCEIIALPTIKPLDEATVLATAMKTKYVVTIEDNVKIGGIGSMIATLLSEKNVGAKVKIYAFPDSPITHGTVDELDKLYGLDADSIADEISRELSGIR
ncbi:MAG: 1-deoxy-D-xylulose-5-phosphate synthase, partial [Oscillospiraceae bacterium]|nr:1-deoxy-D-xylulose-5-phosphate synthase [Oscillospiraceae bacterium]